MAFNKQELIEKLLLNKKIMERVSELNLSKEQIDEALPIMIDMNSQVEDETSLYLISFYVTPTGAVKRMEVLSEIGKKISFKDNIVTNELFPVDFLETEDYFKDDERKTLVKSFAKFLQEPQPTKGLYIYGDMGIGKSFTIKRFAKKIAEQGHKVGIVNLPDLVAKVKGSFNLNERYEQITNMLRGAEFLFIDDIGAEAISTWFRDEFLFGILNSRMDDKKVTFFSSNYNIQDLEKIESRTPNMKYRDFDKAKRLINRIQALATPIHLKGKNKRF